MFEPRPEMSTATRFLPAGFSAIPSPGKIEVPAKVDAGVAALFDHLAEAHDGFAICRENLACGIRRICGQHSDHADAAVERAQHLALADVAGSCEPLEHGRHRHAIQV